MPVRPQFAIAAIITAAGTLSAVAEDASVSPVATTPESAVEFSRFVTNLVKANIPADYENTKRWGMTTERWDGLHVWRDGWQIKTKRRKKEVNHGTWKMYRFHLIDPDERFQIEIDNVDDLGDGRVQFDARVYAHLFVFGRLSEWNKGVQLFSFSAEGDARVRLHVTCQTTLQLDPTGLPPDVVLRPTITEADLRLVDFRLHRISNLHGPLIHEFGKGIREVLEDKIADDRVALAGKINRQIDKNRDHLRVSLRDLLASKWSKLAQPHLPAGTDTTLAP